MLKKELIEQLADKEHAGWAHWMEYLFSRCDVTDDGDGYEHHVIPRKLVERWQRQVATAYADLSEQEKQSDRNQVAEILPSIDAYTEPLRQLIEDFETWTMEIAPHSFQESRKTESIRARLEGLRKPAEQEA